MPRNCPHHRNKFWAYTYIDSLYVRKCASVYRQGEGRRRSDGFTDMENAISLTLCAYAFQVIFD